jgi:ABC-type uncharacterized transport system involved in gliding motility auxiliary subunit
MGGRAVRGWAQLGLQVGLLLVLVGGLQVVSEGRTQRFDLTPTRSFSLSDVTRQVLAEVQEPLAVTVFHQRGRRALYRDLLDRLVRAQPKFTYELYDFDRFPDKARALGVTRAGYAALTYGAHRAVVEAYPEPTLVGGVLRVIRGQRRRLGFVSGHGERPPGGDATGYGRLALALDAENYESQPVNLLAGPVPAELEVLVVAGPARDFLAPEVEQLAAYLQRGRGVFLLLEPGPLPGLTHLLATMGIRLGDDFVVEKERRILGTDGLAAVVERFKPGNPITFPAGRPIEMGAVLPSARTVDVVAERPGVAAEAIAITGDSGWVMADPARARRGEEPSPAQNDRPGAAPVMVMAEVGDGSGEGGTGRPGRLVVIGDADFASDAYLDLLGNRDVAMNAIAWLAGEQALAGQRPANVPEIIRPLSPLVVSDLQARRILIATAVVQPALVMLLGLVVVFLRRRHG